MDQLPGFMEAIQTGDRAGIAAFADWLEVEGEWERAHWFRRWLAGEFGEPMLPPADEGQGWCRLYEP